MPAPTSQASPDQVVQWSDGFTDEWAFEQQQEGSRGPTTRGDLAWLLTKRLLKKYTWVHHITQHPDDGRELQEWVHDWQNDYFHCTGKTKVPTSNRLKQDRTPAWRRYDFLA
ncbi:hypothetical protein WJX82_008892 [Trebouxia sp. C0006]